MRYPTAEEIEQSQALVADLETGRWVPIQSIEQPTHDRLLATYTYYGMPCSIRTGVTVPVRQVEMKAYYHC